MFKITEGKGFHITFANGVCLSVQFGRGSYCENKVMGDVKEQIRYREMIEENSIQSFNAEIGIWIKGRKGWITPEIYRKIYKRKLKYNLVAGWIDADDFAKFVYYCQKYKVREEDK